MAVAKKGVEVLAYDVETASEVVGGVSPELIRLEIRRGRLIPSRVGRRLVITRLELERYLTANKEV